MLQPKSCLDKNIRSAGQSSCKVIVGHVCKDRLIALNFYHRGGNSYLSYRGRSTKFRNRVETFPTFSLGICLQQLNNTTVLKIRETLVMNPNKYSVLYLKPIYLAGDE